MPNRPVHNKFAELFGIDPQLANLVNKHMDAPAKKLGPHHRVVRHDLPYAVRMAAQANRIVLPTQRGSRRANPGEVLAAYMVHVTLDKASENPQLRRIFKLMEVML